MMAGQSFPPLSVLRGLKSFRLDLSIPDSATAYLDAGNLRAKVEKALTAAGFQYFDDETKPVEALICCRVNVITTATNGAGRPVGFAYLVELDVRTTASSLMSSDLFIVWLSSGFGSTEPVLLCRSLENSVAEQANSFAKRLLELQGTGK